MARTPSNMIELGSDLPNFNLINTINNELFDSEVLNLNLGTLVMFVCNPVSYTHLTLPTILLV